MLGHALRWGAPLAAALLAACGAPADAGLAKGGGHDGGAGSVACIVADGAGGARVASHCPAADTYAVGGTVSGATGTLVLDNLGIDTLPVTHDGPFTFSVRLADGAPYAVTITNHPSVHGRVCTVTDGAGVIAHADVNDVAVVCADPPADPPDPEVACADDAAPGAGAVQTPDPPEETADDPPPAAEPEAEATEPPAEAPAEAPATLPEAAPSAAPAELPVVIPAPAGPRWNAYVRADTGAPCDGTEPGPWGTCRHAGEMRDVALPGRVACDGLTGVDDLDAFAWTCEVRDGAAHMVTRALREGVRLSDLVDFAATAWRAEALHVLDGDTEVLATAPGPWWTNPVGVVSDGDLDAPGGIYLVPADRTAQVRLLADGVALVVAPGATLRGPGGEGPVVVARDRAFLWIEGRIDAAGSGEGVRADQVRFSVLDGVKVQGARHAGIHLLDARACRVTDAAAVQNDTYGLLLETGDGNLVRGLLAAGNALSGLHVIAGADNRMADVTAAANGNWGVVLRATSGNVLTGVTAANQVAYGVWLDQSPGNTLMNVAAVNNGTAGVYLFASGGALLANVAATDNGFGGLVLSDSSRNDLTGRVVVGGNPWGCLESGGTAPGLETVTCAGTDGSDPVVTAGVSVADAFVGRVTGGDAVNPDDADGAAPMTRVTEWISFAGAYRHWGREATAFPETAAWGRCSAGDCRIWDWALAPGDTLLRGALAAPDGTTALAHAWSDGAVNVFLPNAVEVVGDGAGDEDLLCEAGETCRSTPNLASDPGAGAFVPLGGTDAAAAVPNVTLLGPAPAGG
jgi:Right handed beta helix region